MKALKSLFIVSGLLFSVASHAATCPGVSSEPVENNPYRYENPNTACGGSFSMPGLPGMSFLQSSNCRGSLGSFSDSAFSNILQRFQAQADRASSGANNSVQGQSREFCQRYPQHCSGQGVRPPSRTPDNDYRPNEQAPLKAQPESSSRYCNPTDPNDPNNSASCVYRKVSPKKVKPAETEDAKDKKKTLENYWKKRYGK